MAKKKQQRPIVILEELDMPDDEAYNAIMEKLKLPPNARTFLISSPRMHSKSFLQRLFEETHNEIHSV